MQKVLDKGQILRYINNRIVSCVNVRSDQKSDQSPSGYVEIQEVSQNLPGSAPAGSGMSNY